MNTNSDVSVKEQTVKPSPLVEVINVEKQLLAWIHSKGILDPDVQDLYRKICSSYEKIILGDNELPQLQDVEYCLWKLHYRYIDEFRKRIKKSSADDAAVKFATPQTFGAIKSSNDNHVDGVKSFLSEASQFYKDLITQIRRDHELPDDFSFSRRGRNSASLEAKKMQKLQFLCHRFLVCLGDLARYREQYEKSDIQNCNWSAAVSHYLEATAIWPDSGNPQNQLAVLAIYVGDEFLALYHCIRSLAVKEPFPDAWNNLILLFEKNRSSQLDSLSKEASFDILNPSESRTLDKSQSAKNLSSHKLVKADKGSGNSNLWPLIIRMISIFFLKSSLEEFPCSFASALEELDLLMALDDAKLKTAMESYQHIDSARSGPYRSLQIVAVFIFVVENLINCPEVKDVDKKEAHQLVLTKLAMTATFIFMGRLVHRCLKANILESCPLLPALLVFVEWLVSILDIAETYASDDRCSSGMSYFYGAFLELLKRLEINKEKVQPSGFTALWEDYELRGFAPVAQSHVLLDFSTHGECEESFERRTYHRNQRIINAAIKIADISNNYGRWIAFDKFGKQFYAAESNNILERKELQKGESTGNVVEVKENHQHIRKAAEESSAYSLEEKPSLDVPGKSSSMEEEEVILFKPLERYNSAPLYNSVSSDDEILLKDTGDQSVPADECLRRATSLLLAQNQTNVASAAFHSDLTNFRCSTQLQQEESPAKDAGAHQFSEASTSPGPPSFSTSLSAGPPSLNAWVLDRGSSSNDRLKGRSDLNKHSLAPIEELPSTSFNGLCLSETPSIFSSRHESETTQYSSPVYSAPEPSAPLLPDDAVWFDGIQCSYPDYCGSGSTTRTDYFFDAPQAGGYSNWSFAYQPLNYGYNVPGLVDVRPSTRPMTSSEWLRQYRESQNLERVNNNNTWPIQSYGLAGNAGNTYSYDMSMCGVFDQWGNPLASNQLIYEEKPPLLHGFHPVYGCDDYRSEKPFPGYQRPNSYGCGAVHEPEPLLQYLKEKEWRLQQDPTLRGPAYIGR